MLDGYRRLAEAVDTRIACGDGGFATRFEFQELMDRGSVDVVQPSSVRSGGITEMLRIAAMAHDRGILCIPHCYAWKVGVAAAAHVAAVTPNMPYIEMPSPDPYSPLVSELLEPDPVPRNGFLEVPQRPGLGYELNEKTVEKYRTEPS
jgi:L-alanine-DL-glutamate epimerase-like enolase superfamily enzyme